MLLSILIAAVVALVAGLIVHFLASLVDFTRPYAQTIALIVAAVVFLVRLGVDL